MITQRLDIMYNTKTSRTKFVGFSCKRYNLGIPGNFDKNKYA